MAEKDPDRLFEGLNDRQKEAVKTTEGPTLILAGAGSGKTRTLTTRIAYLISRKKVSPTNILAVTFTNKAAGEMADRVRTLLGVEGNRGTLPWLGTFHSICVKILRSELDSSRLPHSRYFTIYDASDQLTLIRRIMREEQIDQKQYNPRMIRAQISSAKNDLLDPKNYLESAESRLQATIGLVYTRYQKGLERSNAFDFDDLINQTIRLFEDDHSVLEKYQKIFLYILVDEYQDTNRGQYILIKKLAQKRKNIFVVGDDWQAIYAFRGADYKNILSFESDYPEAKVVKLEENYRSTKQILDAAAGVIGQNRERSEKKLFTKNRLGRKIRAVECQSELEEGEFIVNQARFIEAEGRDNLNDLVVLYRINAQSRQIEEALLKAGVPYRIIGSVRFYDRKEVKDILGYLTAIINPADLVGFERIVNVPPRKIGQKTLLAYRRSLILGDPPPPKVEVFLALLAKLRRSAADLKPEKAIEFILKSVGYQDWLNDGTLEAESRLENLKELQNVASQHETIEDFLERVALIQETDLSRESAQGRERTEAVSLMTIHAAKGLEFKRVVIVGFEENIFPHSRARLNPEDLEEERRLCYVAMTRAKEELSLVYSLSRRQFGQFFANPPSRFFDEIPSHLLDNQQWLGGLT